MITANQKEKMQEDGQLDDLVHDLKSKEASKICNQGDDAEIKFCVDSGMTHSQIVEACGLKPLKCNHFITEGLRQSPKPPTSHEQLVNMLTELLNSVETASCNCCRTVRLEIINKTRRLLGWSELK